MTRNETLHIVYAATQQQPEKRKKDMTDKICHVGLKFPTVAVLATSDAFLRRVVVCFFDVPRALDVVILVFHAVNPTHPPSFSLYLSFTP
jgi:hypothetical protein